MSDFEEELEAIKRQIQDEVYDGLGLTNKQLGGLNNLVSKGLIDPKDRESRLHVIRVLAGSEITRLTGYYLESTKQIPSVVANVLITVLKDSEPKSWRLSDHGRWLVECAERYSP